MKRTVVIILFFTLCYASQWEQIGPYAGLPARIGVAPSNDNIVYGFGNTYPVRVHKTTDGGASWHVTASSFYVVPITFDVAIDPTNPDIVYAGGIDCTDNWDNADTVFKSTDGGVTWSGNSVGSGYIHALAVHPSSTSTILAAGFVWTDNCYMALFKSTDGGMTWVTTQISSDTAGEVYDLCFDPVNHDIVYVAGYRYTTSTLAKVYRSTDGGTTFTDISSGLSSQDGVYSIAVHPTNTQYLYAGTSGGYIYRSTDGGGSWSLVNYDSHGIYALATTPANPDVVYASSSYIIYRSTNAGSSWVASDSGPWGGWGLAVKRTDANTVYNTNYSGFYKSTDGGSNWFLSNEGIDWNSVRGMGIAPSSPTILYTSDWYNYKTYNSGEDWSLLPQIFGGFSNFAIHNNDPNIVFGASSCG